MGLSIVHSCYTIQNAHEVKFSIGLRITAVVLGILLATTGILILSNVPVINQLGTTAGWSMLAIGLFLTFLGSSIKCVQKGSSKTIVTPPVQNKNIEKKSVSTLELHHNVTVNEDLKKTFDLSKPTNQIKIHKDRVYFLSEGKLFCIDNQLNLPQLLSQFESLELTHLFDCGAYLAGISSSNSSLHIQKNRSVESKKIPLTAEPLNWDHAIITEENLFILSGESGNILSYTLHSLGSPTVVTARFGKVNGFTHVSGIIAYSFYGHFQNCVRLFNLKTQGDDLYETNFKELFFYEDKFIGLNEQNAEWEIHSLTLLRKTHCFNSIFEPEEKIVKILIKDNIVFFLHQNSRSFLNLTLFSLTDAKVLKKARITEVGQCLCDMQYENGKLLICVSQDLKLTIWKFDSIRSLA